MTERMDTVTEVNKVKKVKGERQKRIKVGRVDGVSERGGRSLLSVPEISFVGL